MYQRRETNKSLNTRPYERFLDWGEGQKILRKFFYITLAYKKYTILSIVISVISKIH